MAIQSPTHPPTDPGRLEALLTSLEAYCVARVRFLEMLDLAVSNRDPLAEFSEHLVQALLGGRLASNRVQKGYDLIIPSGKRVQVRYLANPGTTRWVNEHRVVWSPGFDLYALVLYESFTPVGVLIFPQDLAAIGAVLRKVHPGQDRSLQLTHANYLAIRQHPARFEKLGMQIWLAPFIRTEVAKGAS